MGDGSKIFFKRKGLDNGQKKSIKEREKVNDLYFKYGISKRVIVREEKVSRGFVDKWTKSPDQGFAEDKRGWEKGKGRKWDKSTERRIREIREYLEQKPEGFYAGATAIDLEWRRRYPETDPPPLRTIGQIMSDLGLTKPNKKGKNKGAAEYLRYPEYTIYNLLGGRVLEADFIGQKHITGRTEPLNFIGFSFKKVPKIRYFKRIEGQRSDDFILQSKHFFREFERPDYMKVDNDPATIGSGSGKGTISRVMIFLLENQVSPIFAVPRRPFTQASIEGNNSVFSRKFWNRIDFKSVEEIDKKIEWFNKASIEYLGYYKPKEKKIKTEEFVPKVYLIRQVEENKEKKEGFINVLNELIPLPKSYIKYYVLAEWNLREEQIYIRFEKEKESEIIENMPFKINPRSKKKCQDILKI
jgi:transposase